MASGHELAVFTDEELFEVMGTRIAFTTRRGGVSEGAYKGLNLSTSTGDAEEAVLTNKQILCEAFNVSDCAQRLFNPKQVHGVDIVTIDGTYEPVSEDPVEADGALCLIQDVPVLLCFADCVPVILVAPNGAFAVLHAGWRGAFGGIPGSGVRALVNATGCLPSEINCYIGPHIGSCCYEVDTQLLAQFIERYGQSCDAGDSHLDLTAAVTASLLEEGAIAKRICNVDVCTSCNTDILYSHRREHGRTGRHGAFAVRKGESWA